MNVMIVLMQMCILILWMVIIPILTGGIWRMASNEWNSGKDLGIWQWVSGQFTQWAAFWIISVPCILLETDFMVVVYAYGFVSTFLALTGAVMMWRKQRNKRNLHLLHTGKKAGLNRSFWILFAGILLFQLVQAVRMTYADGDDAYYVAVSSITADADIMYRKLPYTGGTTGVDIRHGLAPFPIWVSFLAKLSGVRAVSVAHVWAPLLLIPFTYMIFYLMGKKLFAGKEQRIPLFLIFVELLVICGDTSFYTVENFMIARSRQGKAALGSIVIPMLFVLLFVLTSRLEEQKKCGLSFWGVLVCVMMTGCLCSTMGAVLCCLLLAVAGMCAALSYRRWKILFPLALCCVPCVACAILYVVSV